MRNSFSVPKMWKSPLGLVHSRPFKGFWASIKRVAHVALWDLNPHVPARTGPSSQCSVLCCSWCDPAIPSWLMEYPQLEWNGIMEYPELEWNGIMKYPQLEWTHKNHQTQLQIPSVTCHNFPDLGFSKVKFFFIEGAAFDDVAVGQEND